MTIWQGTERRNSRFRLFGLLVMTLGMLVSTPLSATGAKETSTAASGITVVDALDRTVTLAHKPQRVLIVGKSSPVLADAFLLFPEAAGSIIELPKTDQGTGDLYSLLQPELADGPRTPEIPSVEEVIARAPDLVLMKDFSYSGLGDKLEAMGLPVFTISLEMPEDWRTELVEIGKIVEAPRRASQLVELYRNRQDAVSSAISVVPEENRPSVLMMRVSSTDGLMTYTVAPDIWMQTRFVQDAGGVPVWLGAGFANKGFAKISFEQIAAWDPDYIYIYSYKDPAQDYVSRLKTDKRWADIPAVKAGHVKAIPGDFSSYAQPVSRWILCLQWMAADLYPNLFPGFDMEQEVRSFYTDFHGLSDESSLEQIIDRYRESVRAN